MKYDKNGLRLTSCVQIDTSNTALNESELDFSNGAVVPQFISTLQRVFKDIDIMYTQSFDPDELDEQQIEQQNSKEMAENAQGLLID